MRLTDAQLKIIREMVDAMMPDDISYTISLFGSRLDNNARGGDVDLYLETNGLAPRQQGLLKRRLRPLLEDALDLPVDLIIRESGENSTLIAEIARNEGVRI